MVSFAQVTCLPLFTQALTFWGQFPLSDGSGEWDNIFQASRLLVYISSFYSPCFWHTLLPGLKFPLRKLAGISRGFTLSWTSDVIMPPAPYSLQTSEAAGESERSGCCLTWLLPAFLLWSIPPRPLISINHPVLCPRDSHWHTSFCFWPISDDSEGPSYYL